MIISRARISPLPVAEMPMPAMPAMQQPFQPGNHFLLFDITLSLDRKCGKLLVIPVEFLLQD